MEFYLHGSELMQLHFILSLLLFNEAALKDIVGMSVPSLLMLGNWRDP